MTDESPTDNDTPWHSDEKFQESFGVPRQEEYICLGCGKTAYPPEGDVDTLDPEAAHIQFLDGDDDAIIVCWECLQDDDWEERARERRAQQEGSDHTTEAAVATLEGWLQAVVQVVLGIGPDDTDAATPVESAIADPSANRDAVEKLEWKLEQEREWASYLEDELRTKDDRLIALEEEIHHLRQQVDDDGDRPSEPTINPQSPLLSTIFDVREALARAIAETDADSEFRDGLVRIDQQLVDALEQEGIEQIETTGEANPHRHKVVETIPTAEHPPGTILEEYRAGYQRGGAVLRSAQVAVAAEPRDDPGSRSGADDAGDDQA